LFPPSSDYRGSPFRAASLPRHPHVTNPGNYFLPLARRFVPSASLFSRPLSHQFLLRRRLRPSISLSSLIAPPSPLLTSPDESPPSFFPSSFPCSPHSLFLHSFLWFPTTERNSKISPLFPFVKYENSKGLFVYEILSPCAGGFRSHEQTNVLTPLPLGEMSRRTLPLLPTLSGVPKSLRPFPPNSRMSPRIPLPPKGCTSSSTPCSNSRTGKAFFFLGHISHSPLRVVPDPECILYCLHSLFFPLINDIIPFDSSPPCSSLIFATSFSPPPE